MIPTLTKSMYISIGVFIVVTLFAGFALAIVIASLAAPFYYLKENSYVLKQFVAIALITLVFLVF